jgi:hypothetical protein
MDEDDDPEAAVAAEEARTAAIRERMRLDPTYVPPAVNGPAGAAAVLRSGHGRHRLATGLSMHAGAGA